MSEQKQVIFFTDIGVHARDLASTTSIKTALKNKRFFVNARDLKLSNIRPNSDGGFSGDFQLQLSPEVFDAFFKNKDIVPAFPKAGLPVQPARDLREKLRHLVKKSRNLLIHRSRGKTWHAPPEGV